MIWASIYVGFYIRSLKGLRGGRIAVQGWGQEGSDFLV